MPDLEKAEQKMSALEVECSSLRNQLQKNQEEIEIAGKIITEQRIQLEEKEEEIKNLKTKVTDLTEKEKRLQTQQRVNEKFGKSRAILDDILSKQRSSLDKSGIGFYINQTERFKLPQEKDDQKSILQETTRRKVMIRKGKISEGALHKRDQSFPGIKICLIFMVIATNAINMVTGLPIVEDMAEIIKLKLEVCFLFKFNATTVTIMDTLQKNAHKYGKAGQKVKNLYMKMM